MIFPIIFVAATAIIVTHTTPPPPVTAIPIYLPTVPGAVNPAVTQANIKTTICVSGWTKTIRPPTSYTNKLKKKQMAALGLTGEPRDYEEDHIISLQLGGHPTDPNNLFPEPWTGEFNAHIKDKLETRLKRMVCRGDITLVQAQKEISQNWTIAYQRYYP